MVEGRDEAKEPAMSRRRWWTRVVPALTLLVAGGLATPALAAPATAAPGAPPVVRTGQGTLQGVLVDGVRSEEHTSELQSH